MNYLKNMFKTHQNKKDKETNTIYIPKEHKGTNTDPIYVQKQHKDTNTDPIYAQEHKIIKVNKFNRKLITQKYEIIY